MPKADSGTVVSTTNGSRKSPAEPLGALSALMDAIQTFSGTDGHRTLKCHLEEVEGLKSSLERSEKALISLQSLITKTSIDHAEVMQKADEYRRQVEQLQTAATIAEKKNATLEENLGKQRAAIEKARTKGKEQADELKVKSAAIAELETKLKNAEARANAADSRVVVAEGTSAKLEQRNGAVTSELNAIKSLSLPLGTMDPSTV